MKAGELRKKYPVFIYKGYEHKIKNNDLVMSFDFAVGDIKFRPKIVVKNVSLAHIKRVGDSGMDTLVFHMGLAEMPSYWKATASPKIIVEAGSLTKAQISWWHDLFIQGMGEYFYKNKIDFRSKNFLTIEAKKSTSTFLTIVRKVSKKQHRTLIPIGGGKDAIVTYEILKQAKQNITPFILNPTATQKALIKKMGEGNALVVQKTIDPKLLELNRKGYLNGHTPFSAYLAFLSTFVATLFDYTYIAVSNERSSNEGNVRYLGYEINHQYSKSWEFERKFRAYSKKHLVKNIEYVSFLRPLYELQIAKLFSAYPKYFSVFLSCNEAHKTNSGKTQSTGKWCGACPKCLFVFAGVYPFIETKTLVKIFGKNLFADASLIQLMEELTGERGFKPFECVGTAQESLTAFYLSLQKTHPPLPSLLRHFRQHIAKKHETLPKQSKTILSAWNKHHALPPHLEKTLARMLQ